MSKEQHIAYWKESAEKDWDTCLAMLKAKKYVPALFYAHLTIEKLIKAHWVKDNLGNTPPFSHELINLTSQTDLELTGTQLDLLRIVNSWNIESRYPDYKFSLYKTADNIYTGKQLKNIELLRTCLLERL